MKWYIGQPIVAVRTHSWKYFKEGQDFKIIGLKMSGCKCNSVIINIGIINPAIAMICIRCNATIPNIDGYCYFSDFSFAPLDQAISELTEILTQKQPFEG